MSDTTLEDFDDDDDDFDDIEEAPKSENRGSFFSIDEAVGHLSPWIVEKCLNGRAFVAKDALIELRVFRESGMSRANAIGDALGQRGLKLWRGKKGFPPCYENAGLAMRRMSPEAQAALAEDLGHESLDALKSAIKALPKR
jgi:hypothetical protein